MSDRIADSLELWFHSETRLSFANANYYREGDDLVVYATNPLREIGRVRDESVRAIRMKWEGDKPPMTKPIQSSTGGDALRERDNDKQRFLVEIDLGWSGEWTVDQIKAAIHRALECDGVQVSLAPPLIKQEAETPLRNAIYQAWYTGWQSHKLGLPSTPTNAETESLMELVTGAASKQEVVAPVGEETRELLYLCIKELDYVQSVPNCESELCATAVGAELIELGMKALGVKDLSTESLPGTSNPASVSPAAPPNKDSE